MAYKSYILPIGWIYITYHLSREPETAVEKLVGFKIWSLKNTEQKRHMHPLKKWWSYSTQRRYESYEWLSKKNIEKPSTKWFNLTFWSLSWRSLNLSKGNLTILKRSQRIVHQVQTNESQGYVFPYWLELFSLAAQVISKCLSSSYRKKGGCKFPQWQVIIIIMWYRNTDPCQPNMVY